MFLNTVKWAGVAVLVCGLAFTGVGVMARQDAKAKQGRGAASRRSRWRTRQPKSPPQ